PQDQRVRDTLHLVTSTLAEVEERPGQDEMAMTIARSIDKRRHLVVQAGTGTGKTLGYLVPAILSGKRTVVATYTKALQDQLAMHDLPILAKSMAEVLPNPLSWAVLKGRQNYVCLQRMHEIHSSPQDSLDLKTSDARMSDEIARLKQWSEETESGDGGELSWTPSDTAWRRVSVGSDECPGAIRCPSGAECFTERARRKAEQADIIVVNTFLYGLHIASERGLLPEHEVVIFDEAHQLEDVISATNSVEISPGRVSTVAVAIRSIVHDESLSSKFADSGNQLRQALAPHVDKQLVQPIADDVRSALVNLRLHIDSALSAMRAIASDDESAKQRKLRAQGLCARLAENIDIGLGSLQGFVAFVSGSGERPALQIAPLDVGPALENGVWSMRTAILTSATVPLSLPQRIGLPDDLYDAIDVGSPFNYEQNAMLYCAKHLPEPNSPLRDDAVHDEIAELITAAGGRTLALFTTYRAMHAAADAMHKRLPFHIWRQDDLPKMALLDEFARVESSCLFATAGFFQGVDVPGRTLSLVIIDKLPFPRPDDPLLMARRELVGRSAFTRIDLPMAATQLAQAAGRLIRSRSDKGVVAVLDPRLATKSYGKQIIETLPPMVRTIDRQEVEDFLRFATRE
ncbi:MAG: ATP-dependent DNA helicase, partial [Ilumatobacteraceae bacterium]